LPTFGAASGAYTEMDVDKLLEGEEVLPCTLLHEGRHLAMLDPAANPDLPLEPGSSLQLPLWLAKSLGERRHVELQLPKHYDVQYRNALKADASVLDLHRCSGFYFDVGMQLSRLRGDEELATTLLNGFSDRFHRLLDASLNVTEQADSTALKEKLTLRERQLFDSGRDASRQWTAWKSDHSTRIKQSALVDLHRRKGKRARGVN